VEVGWFWAEIQGREKEEMGRRGGTKKEKRLERGGPG
jgi:hypothetical protein